MVILLVKLIVPPVHTAPVVLVILIVGATTGTSVTVKLLLVAVVGDAQLTLLVSTQLNTSPLAGALAV